MKRELQVSVGESVNDRGRDHRRREERGSATHGRHETECRTEAGAEHRVRLHRSTAVASEEDVEREPRCGAGDRPEDRPQPARTQSR